MKPARPVRRQKNGFALLIVFLMAAAISIMLITENMSVPRVSKISFSRALFAGSDEVPRIAQ